jgi:hypothetical protein
VHTTNKTDRHDIAEILLKVTLNTIKQNVIVFGLTRTGAKSTINCTLDEQANLWII